MLGTFRNLYQEVVDKNAQGEPLLKLKAKLDRMEQLSLEMDDIGAFSAKLTTESLFVDFSNLYGEIAGALAAKQYAKATTDTELLEQTLATYENSLQSYANQPEQKSLYDAMLQIIQLGRSGITYPVFLRLCEEKGFYKMLEGGTITRAALVDERTFYEIFLMPLHLQKASELIVAYDQLAALSPFKTPDLFAFELQRIRLDWHYLPLQNRWDATVRAWERLFELVYDWLDSFCDFAPVDFRWADLGNPQATQKNIKRTNDCNPGFLKQRERIFFENFQLHWADVFTHPTFLNEMKAGRVWYSDELFALICETYPHCVPYGKPPADFIRRAEEIHHQKRFKRPHSFELTPQQHQNLLQLLGKEKYEQLYGNPA